MNEHRQTTWPVPSLARLRAALCESLLLALSFTLCAPPARATGVPEVHQADPHRFSRSGAGWYPVGYYPAIGAFVVDQLDQTYYRRFFDKLAEHRINYIRTIFNPGQPYGGAMELYQRTGPGSAVDGRPRFDLTRFNDSYFRYWRNVLDYAFERGIVVQLIIQDAWHNKAEVVEDNGPGKAWGMRYDYFAGPNNINGLNTSNHSDWLNSSHPSYEHHAALVRRLVDEFGDLPNLVWEIANESGNTRWEIALAELLSDYEESKQFPRHLVMPRDLPGHQYVPGQCDNDAASTHHALAFEFVRSRILITDNDCVGPDTPEIRRKKAWGALTAGAHISLFHFRAFEAQVLDGADVTDGMRYLGYLRKFLEERDVDLVGMAPADNLVSRGWSLARREHEYILYLMTGGRVQIHHTPDEYDAIWFNPRDGAFQPASGPVFVAPDAQDWVLHVRATTKKPPLPAAAIVSPVHGSMVSGRVPVEVAVVAATAPASMQVRVGGLDLPVDSQRRKVELDTAMLASGSHSLVAVIKDPSGAVVESLPVTLIVAHDGGGIFRPIRINTGGGAIGGNNASEWSTDFGYDSGVVYQPDNLPGEDALPEPYRSMRWGKGGQFVYQFNVPVGDYEITLKFAELYFNESGRRVFDVVINGKDALRSFDIVAEAGGTRRPVDRTFHVQAPNGILSIRCAATTDNPQINGIEILRRPAREDTPSSRDRRGRIR